MFARLAIVALCILGAGCTREDAQPRAVDTAARGSDAPARPPALSAPVTDVGIGPLRFGMTVAEAEAALPGIHFPKGAEKSGCARATVPGMPKGVSLMIENGIVVRVDVDTSSVPTVEGARVGDSEASVRQLYGARLTVSPHKYTDGHYLTVRSSTATDTVHRLIFETDKSRVLVYRAGTMPQVAYVEGCG